MKNLVTHIVICLMVLAGVPVFASAENLSLSVGGVSVTADNVSRDEAKDILQAKGNVVVKWGLYTLLSDSVVVKLNDSEAFAEGNVRLKKEGIDFSTDRARMNYDTETGEAGKGSIFVKQRNFTLKGDHFFKTGQDDYRVERGSFTTCEGDSPSWKFTASDLEITIDDYAVGRNAVFYVGEMPIFYTPYIVFPVLRERQSGFLFSRFGNSSKKGFNLDIPYYWAISPSQEATFDLDLQTRRGAGLGMDYRYLRPNDSSGQIKGYIIYDISRSPAPRGLAPGGSVTDIIYVNETEGLRGDLIVKQQEAISPGLLLTSDLRFSSDRNFYRDYGEVSGDYNRQLLDSTLFLTKNWAGSSLAFAARYVEDLYTTSNKETMQKLPDVTYTLTRSPIGATPFYFGLESAMTNFYEEVGPRGQRLDLHPTVSYYRTLSPGLNVAAWGGYRERVYGNYGGDVSERTGSRGEGLLDGGISVSAPLARVYDTGRNDLLSVRHSLVPELRYSLVEQKSQQDLPFFDYKDRIPGQRMIYLSLTNFVTGKYAEASGTPSYRDIFYFRLSEGYQISGTRRDELTLVDEGRRFTDIRMEARYWLAKNLNASVDSRYNPYMTRISTASLRLDMEDGKGNLAGIGYQYAREQLNYLQRNVDDSGRLQYLEGKMTLALVDPFLFKFTSRYSFEKKDFLETVYSVEYKKQCWSVVASYQDRQSNKQFMVSFTLAGIGSFGPLKAF